MLNFYNIVEAVKDITLSRKVYRLPITICRHKHLQFLLDVDNLKVLPELAPE
jgi:hypothetical protein